MTRTYEFFKGLFEIVVRIGHGRWTVSVGPNMSLPHHPEFVTRIFTGHGLHTLIVLLAHYGIVLPR